MKFNTPRANKYLTLVYQIDIGTTRLLWVGRERTIRGPPLSAAEKRPVGHLPALRRAHAAPPGMDELIQFVCAHCGNPVEVKPPKIQ
jgi:hypothetical protein